MLEALGASLAGARILEVGGGSGIAQLEMLRRGAGSTLCVELSEDTAAEAEALLREAGFEGRFSRIHGDFVHLAPTLGRADVVFLNRVVCCYPDMPALVDAAVGRAGGRAAFSFPRDRWWVRLQFSLMNLLLRLRRIDFRVFVHDPDAVTARLRDGGMIRLAGGTTPMWHWSVWEAG
ncbi:MAG TPA: methyltransferase domain-containing protein [Gemmatimonadales bacterium]|nr:methyltransferase domain-containing protein [Gemmatimonadales bacterium]